MPEVPAGFPEAYAWLYELAPLPRMVTEALREFGVRETPGTVDNPVIMGWAEEVSEDLESHQYGADSVAWCGLFITVVARRAGKTPVRSPLWALNWKNFGTDGGQPMLGDLLVFVRNDGGHVAVYLGEDEGSYHILGGNQKDTDEEENEAVCIVPRDKSLLRAVRRPPYQNMPATVQPYMLNADGTRR